MSTGAKKAAQHRMDQKGGGQMVGGMDPVDRARVPAFQGKSGQPDNQSTSRGKGKT
jgi:hypothetical protein